MTETWALVRVFARCASTGEAAALQLQLLAALGRLGPAGVRETPQRYWKMPELFEFTFSAAAPMQQITALCPSGWKDCGDEDTPSWVWNAEPGAAFLHPAVTWAEVLKDG